MNSSSQKKILTTIIGLIVAFTAGDMIADYNEGSDFGHLFIEACLILLSFSGIALIWRENLQLGRNVKNLSCHLDSTQNEMQRWRREAEFFLRGLSQSIDDQFNTWGLTTAEKEVGFLLLKGLSLKDAADIRGTSERTVRQQAQEIYEKAGIAGRAEFSAFFLEDLLTPAYDTTNCNLSKI